MTLFQLSATQAARGIAAGRLTSEALVGACLERARAREPVLKAWAHLPAEDALAAARTCDAAAPAGPLHGVPVGVKDVIDVAGMPCGMGSPIHDRYRPAIDAACVALLRAAGAVILGKTVTAEFAGITAGPTTHPLAPARTPGGSSSGSAAAVADGSVPVALGTQTGGSILRPAAFCGVVGFKPTYGTVSRAGLKFAAESLDTIGVIARDLDDAALAWSVMAGRRPAPLATMSRPPRIALFRSHHWHRAAPETVAAVERTAATLAASGATVDDLPPPDGFAALSAARAVINNVERARAMAWEWAHHRDRISPALARVLADGWARPYDEYRAALRLAERWRLWFDDMMDGPNGGYDAVLTASVNGEAPEGLDSTGDTAFQEIWTVLHTPAITLPLHRGPNGLPVGVQLVGRRLDDDALLATARWTLDQHSGGRHRAPPSA